MINGLFIADKLVQLVCHKHGIGLIFDEPIRCLHTVKYDAIVPENLERTDLKAIRRRIGQPQEGVCLRIAHAQVAAHHSCTGRELFDEQHIPVIQPIGECGRVHVAQAVERKLPFFTGFKITHPKRTGAFPGKALVVQQPRSVRRDLNRRKRGSDFRLRTIRIADLHLVGQMFAVNRSVGNARSVYKSRAVSQRAFEKRFIFVVIRRFRPFFSFQRGGKRILKLVNTVGQGLLLGLFNLKQLIHFIQLRFQCAGMLPRFGKLLHGHLRR